MLVTEPYLATLPDIGNFAKLSRACRSQKAFVAPFPNVREWRRPVNAKRTECRLQHVPDGILDQTNVRVVHKPPRRRRRHGCCTSFRISPKPALMKPAQPARPHPHAEATYRIVPLKDGAFGLEVVIPGTSPTTVTSSPPRLTLKYGSRGTRAKCNQTAHSFLGFDGTVATADRHDKTSRADPSNFSKSPTSFVLSVRQYVRRNLFLTRNVAFRLPDMSPSHRQWRFNPTCRSLPP